jgi:hypothetical protein
MQPCAQVRQPGLTHLVTLMPSIVTDAAPSFGRSPLQSLSRKGISRSCLMALPVHPWFDGLSGI